MASIARNILRPARRALWRRTGSNVSGASYTTTRPLSTTVTLRATPSISNTPPVDPFKSGTVHSDSDAAVTGDLEVGEMEGASFRVEPLRRVGEDEETMRSRLIYQSRKRGTLESDLLLSTFADEFLPVMTKAQMAQYDLFLDENDWDIYYWATQDSPSNPTIITTSSDPSAGAEERRRSAAGPDEEAVNYSSRAEILVVEQAMSAASVEHRSTGGVALSGDSSEGKESHLETAGADPNYYPGGSSSESRDTSNAASAAAAAGSEPYRQPGEGEWAQTVGTFKPSYRPVPARWRDSEVLRLLRQHVRNKAKETGGMAFMPALKTGR